MRTLWRRCFIDNSYNDKAKFDQRLRSVNVVFINIQVNSRLTLRLNWNPSSEFDFTESLSLSVSELLALFLPACWHDNNEKGKQDNKGNTMERSEQTWRALSDGIGYMFKFYLFLLHQFSFGFLHFHKFQSVCLRALVSAGQRVERVAGSVISDAQWDGQWTNQQSGSDSMWIGP